MLHCTMGAPTLPARSFPLHHRGVDRAHIAAAIGWNLFQDRIMRAALRAVRAFSAPKELPRRIISSPPLGWPGPICRMIPRASSHPASSAQSGRRWPSSRAADQLHETRPLERPARRCRRQRASAPFRFVAGERLQRHGRRLGTTLPPGDAGRLHGRGRQLCRPRSTSPIRMSRAPSMPSSRRSRSRGRSCLAGHSQGSLHLMRLMAEKVAGKPVAKRIVAAYVVGWPVSETGRSARHGPARGLHRPQPVGLRASLAKLRRARRYRTTSPMSTMRRRAHRLKPRAGTPDGRASIR